MSPNFFSKIKLLYLLINLNLLIDIQNKFLEKEIKTKNQPHLYNSYNIFDNNSYKFNVRECKTPDHNNNKLKLAYNTNKTNEYSSNKNHYQNQAKSNGIIINSQQNLKTLKNSTNSQTVLGSQFNQEKKTTKSVIVQPENNNVIVKHFNTSLGKIESYRMLDWYKETGKEREFIPYPKAKVVGYKNPYISQFTIK